MRSSAIGLGLWSPCSQPRSVERLTLSSRARRSWLQPSFERSSLRSIFSPFPIPRRKGELSAGSHAWGMGYSSPFFNSFLWVASGDSSALRRILSICAMHQFQFRTIVPYGQQLGNNTMLQISPSPCVVYNLFDLLLSSFFPLPPSPTERIGDFSPFVNMMFRPKSGLIHILPPHNSRYLLDRHRLHIGQK